MKKIRGYNFSRPFMGERVPQHVQNIVIKDFCQKNGFNLIAFDKFDIALLCSPDLA